MAETKDTTPKAPKPPKGDAPKHPKGGKEKGGAALATDPAPKSAEGVPRLKTYYDKVIRPNLAKQFGMTNPHAVPRIVKVVLNVGMGEGAKNPKLIETIAEELAIISGQKPVVRRAKKAIANFGLRQGLPIGVSVTLRNARMYEFLDRFINIAVPRLRDFRGLPNKSFDGRGNYTVGIKEQMIFPEIEFDKVEKIHGMDITVVTTAGRDDLALALLREFGWPFRGETPLAVAS
ncbi:MAG TPA: 50S ribosomal protein L5 [Gemmatimonadales bacterium]|nr:50S ribosomal protein L5 [Gemmatimonadales bacterium]